MAERNKTQATVNVDIAKKGLVINGMSGLELADKIEMAPTTVYKALRGNAVSPKTVKKIADGLGIDVKELLECVK